MANPKINWEDARYFLTIARAGKLNRAAQHLGISPVTLSRRMANMEARMKTVLLVRHNSGIELTDEGHDLIGYLERAEAELERAGEVFDQPTARISGTVRVAAPEGFAHEFLAKNLHILATRHPHLKLEIVPLPRGFSLSRREADIAIMVGRPEGKDLHTQLLANYHMGLFAAKGYAGGLPQSPAELADHKLIGYVDDLLFSERINTMREAWVDWNNHISINSPLGQIEAVRSGAGIGVLHHFLIRHRMDDFIPVLPDIKITRQFWLVTHSQLRDLARIDAATKFIEDMLVWE